MAHLGDVEGISDQGGTRHHDLEDASIGAGQIKGAELDALTERRSFPLPFRESCMQTEYRKPWWSDL